MTWINHGPLAIRRTIYGTRNQSAWLADLPVEATKSPRPTSRSAGTGSSPIDQIFLI